jgi:hypothetical protein
VLKDTEEPKGQLDQQELKEPQELKVIQELKEW